MEALHKWTEMDDKKYARITGCVKTGSILLILCFVVFAYLANIRIDTAGDSLYRSLDVAFYVFCASLPFALAAVAGLIVVHAKRKKLYYQSHNKSKLGKKIGVFDVVNGVLLGLFCICCVYPMIYVLAGSFNQGADYAVGGVYFLPRLFTFENYKVVLSRVALWRSYLVTIGRTVIGTSTALVFTAAVAYAMSRPNLKFKKGFYWINLFTMFFSGGLIPYFLIIKTVGLFNSFWVYVIPGLYSVYNMIVIQSGFKAISNEIHDAAFIDGAGELRIWWHIYMPLAKPVLATVTLWIAIGHWNSYFDSMIYISNEKLYTLQYYLLQTIQTSSGTEGMPPEAMERLSPKTVSLATIIVSVIPVLFFFPLVRKNFSSGIMVGSLKG